MECKKLKHFVDLPKQQKLKKVIVFALAAMLVLTVVFNISTFSRAINKINYDRYLAGLYKIKNEKGISALKEINDDFCGWISCKDVEIELPFVAVKSESEEEFYLDHDFEKKSNELGTPYQKFSTQIGKTGNTVLVAHSAFNQNFFNISKNQSIFGKLENYMYSNSLFDYKISVETLSASFEYKVIGVIRFKADDVYGEEFAIYRTSRIETEEQFNKFYSAVKQNSVIKNLDTARYGDKFLTLFTCWTQNLDYRVMVIAKQV